MDSKQFSKLISPYEQHFDPTHKRHYFYDPKSKTSLWELPPEILHKIQTFYEMYSQEQATAQKNEASSNQAEGTHEIEGQKNADPSENSEETNKNTKQTEQLDDDQAFQELLPKNPEATMDAYIPAAIRQKISRRTDEKLAKILSRPARKQLEQSLADKVAYKEGDQEYNIWYGRYLSDTRDTVRDHKTPARTRCNSELDSGYTRADITDKYNSYFCHHWAKGCCAEGQNCRYYHRVPCFAECVGIDNQRDIFGRVRHAAHREDRGGVGSFNIETRSIEVKDFKAPTEGVGIITQMYEILFRHFSEWGDIADIRYFPNQVKAVVRYSHRCMAEFAKEAMQHQALDRSEVINLKWFLEHKDQEKKELYEKEQQNQLLRAVEKQQGHFKTRAEYMAYKEQLKQQKRQEYLANKRKVQSEIRGQQGIERMKEVFKDEEDDDAPEEQEKNQNADGNETGTADYYGTAGLSVGINSFPQYGQYCDSQNAQIAEYYRQQALASQYHAEYYKTVREQEQNKKKEEQIQQAQSLGPQGLNQQTEDKEEQGAVSNDQVERKGEEEEKQLPNEQGEKEEEEIQTSK